MVYWILVLTLWLVSLAAVAFGGARLFEYLKTGNQEALYAGAAALALGVLLNFLVVNWPTGGPARLDQKTLKALKLMAKTAPLAPKAVKEGLEKVISKFS
ncbi:MAG: hypothetical protein GXO08_00235 [Aquificae bacterium]|nr:hypothetical protein [Aquificota bacterium]